MSHDPHILIIEDEPPMQYFLRSLLEGHGMKTTVCGNAKDGTLQAASRSPDLILLDLGLPDGDGMDVVERIRSWSAVPIIVLSARGKDRDKVQALDGGADDYLTKPFSADELMARVRVAIRRAAANANAANAVYRSGGLAVDLARRLVTLDEQDVSLTPTEYKILEMLVRHAGKVLTHAQILRHVWGPNALTKSHYVRVHMHQLRSKIASDEHEDLIATEPGVGYRIAEAD